MPFLRRIPVQSSSIRSLAYESARQWMEIEFSSGHIYRYYEVPAEVFSEFLQATSYGSYFHQHIRDVYPYDQLS
jgi:hypothetical protein